MKPYEFELRVTNCPSFPKIEAERIQKKTLGLFESFSKSINNAIKYRLDSLGYAFETLEEEQEFAKTRLTLLRNVYDHYKQDRYNRIYLDLNTSKQVLILEYKEIKFPNPF